MALTRFEKARILSARALQIAMGAPVLVRVQTSDPITIARSELEKSVLPLTVVRTMPDGTQSFVDVREEKF
jgi:DNA-directed RNA polymerase subunit K